MSKQDLLIEYITQDIVTFLIEDLHIEIKEAIGKLYNSETYEKLLDTETGLYLEGSAYVYDILKTEIEFGTLVQIEV
jgi:hypothetical protein